MHFRRLPLFAGALLLTACAGGDDDPAESATTTFSTTDPSTTAEETGEPSVCTPGVQVTCPCPDGGAGVQVCNPEGTGLEECQCDGDSDSADSTGPGESTGEPTTGEPDPCGDLTCDEDTETCNTCPEDCGECVPCTSAPSCEGAQIPPVIDTHADTLDDVQLNYVPPDEAFATIVALVEEGRPGMRAVIAALDEPVDGEHPMIAAMRDAFAAHPLPTAALRRQLAAAGIASVTAYRTANPEPRVSIDQLVAEPAAHHGGEPQPCENPRLRIRIARIDVPEEDDDFLNDQIYCVIAAEGSEASEIRLTPITPALDEGDSHEFSLGEGIVWGQMDLAAPKGNLALTYNCIESESPETYNGLFDAIGDAAQQAGGVAGDSGWIFDTVGVVANLLPAVIGLDGDDLLFNANQIIPEDMHLALTQGAYWEVARSGTNLNSDWEWHIRMEIWGCHDNGQ